jgi:hypothetical protein
MRLSILLLLAAAALVFLATSLLVESAIPCTALHCTALKVEGAILVPDLATFQLLLYLLLIPGTR